MDNLDLDINNYELEDLLNLFKIPMDFDESDLKKAKQIVLKTHPDKSGLDAKYFYFFQKLIRQYIQYIVLKIIQKKRI